MRRRGLRVLVLAALFAVAAMVAVRLKRNTPWEGSGHHLKVFSNLAVNDVGRIRVVAPNAGLTIDRKEDRWRVAERNGYPADFSKVRDLLRTLWELKAVRELQVGPSQFDRLQISPPGKGPGGGTQVELTDAQSKSLGALTIGKSLEGNQDEGGPPASGRFVYQPANKDHVYVVSEGFYDLEPVAVSNWLDHDFIGGGDLDKVVRDDAPNNQGWTMVRPTAQGEWNFADASAGEKVKSESGNLLGHFSPSFTDVRPENSPPAETGLDQPVRADLHTIDGFTYKLSLGKSGPENVRFLKVQVDAQLPSELTVKPNEKAADKKPGEDDVAKKAGELKARLGREKAFEGWVYLVPVSTVETLLKSRGDLVAGSKSSPGSVPSDHQNSSPTEIPPEEGKVNPSPSLPAIPGQAPKEIEAGQTARPALASPSPAPQPAPQGTP